MKCQWCGKETDEVFFILDRDTLQEVGICGNCQIEIDMQMEIMNNV